MSLRRSRFDRQCRGCSSSWCRDVLPGFNGHLVSEAYLEALTPASAASGGALEPSVDRIHRDLVKWRARSVRLGPASAPRTLLQDRAAPLVHALGFDPPTDIVAIDGSLAATMTVEGQPVTLVVTPWGERLDPLWRLAVTQAMQRSSAWCLLFNGVRLRIVDASRLYARRYVEFDLDLTIDDPRTFLALWRTANAAALASAAAHDRSLHAIVAASDRHSLTVCRSLRDGVLAASGDILGALVLRRRAAV